MMKTTFDEERDRYYPDEQKDLQKALKKHRRERNKRGMATDWYGLATIDLRLVSRQLSIVG